MRFSIAKINAIPCTGVDPLLKESLAEGHTCLEKLHTEWCAGRNRFDQHGEFYLGVYADDTLAGLGGLSIDPYTTQTTVGRVRHLFVTQRYRRAGAATALVREIIKGAMGTFDSLHLRTPKNSAAADSFYMSLGFHRVINDDYCTHRMILPQIQNLEEMKKK